MNFSGIPVFQTIFKQYQKIRPFYRYTGIYRYEQDTAGNPNHNPAKENVMRSAKEVTKDRMLFFWGGGWTNFKWEKRYGQIMYNKVNIVTLYFV